MNDILALGGGGHFALCLDGDLLSGNTGPSDTFENSYLTHDQEFELKNVEEQFYQSRRASAHRGNPKYQVLEGVIKYRWNALPVEQRDGMKNYISELIVKLSSDEASFRREKLYVSKLNIILVQILKHEWPARWRSFIPDLVAAAKTSETICENCMAILKLLSEEVFDFSRGEMTQQKIKELKQSLNRSSLLIDDNANPTKNNEVQHNTRWKNGAWDLNMFVKNSKMDWDGAIVAKAKRRKFLELFQKLQQTKNLWSLELLSYHGGHG